MHDEREQSMLEVRPAPSAEPATRPQVTQTAEQKMRAQQYWCRDRWDAGDAFFDPFDRTEHPWDARPYAHIDFTCLPPGIRDEAKRFFAWQLQHQLLRLSTAFAYGMRLRVVAVFLSETYPTLTSLANIPRDEALARFRRFLRLQGRGDDYVTVLRQLVQSVVTPAISGTRQDTVGSDVMPWSDFDGDRWDLRRIPGARIPLTRSAYYLTFSRIPLPFRALAKRYLRVRIASGKSWDQCYCDIRALEFFCAFLHERRPTWTNWVDLSRSDMEAFLEWFRGRWIRLHGQPNTSASRHYLIALRQCLSYVQRAQYSEAPAVPLALLLWREDIPREVYTSERDIQYIPETVLQQLEVHLEHLRPATYIPIVILLRASGWRISDVLNLRYDTCLEHTGLGWYLCGDIVKTQVLNHRIPITDEVAALVQAVIEETKAHSTPENNPERFLFVRYEGRRRGRPPQGAHVALALNRLATAHQIATDQGTLFHFANHAFRHTKAVELINNGMSLLHVQKWLAHASPEMTLRYARILDDTLRQAWVEATKDGVFRLDGVGGMARVELGDLANEDQVEWAYIRTHLDAVRMPHGYCFKPLKQPCPAQEQPCLSCRNLCTTPAFLPEFERQIAGTQELIAEGKARGRVLWVDKNTTLLGRLDGVAQALRDQKTHHTAGKRGREYVGEERRHVPPSTQVNQVDQHSSPEK